MNLALEMVESVSWSTSIGVLGHATLGLGTYGLLLLMVIVTTSYPSTDRVAVPKGIPQVPAATGGHMWGLRTRADGGYALECALRRAAPS